MPLDRLDDPHHPVYSMGQAAELLDVTPAFLRNLDATGLLRPGRSDGGHRRYSRHQLDRVAELRALTEQGHTLTSAAEILDLRADLDGERARHAATSQERDRAVRERDTARDERDTALRERDRARDERDTVRRAQDQDASARPET